MRLSAAAPPETRVAAAIARLWEEVQVLYERSQAYLAGGQQLDLMAGLRVQDDEGNTLDPDAVLDALARNVATTIVMEATRNKWLRDGIVELPPLPSPPAPAVFESGSTYLLAQCWRNWSLVEAGARFLGADLHCGPPCPDDTLSPEVDRVFLHRPPPTGHSDAERYGFVAHLRLLDRLHQSAMELQMDGRLARLYVGIDKGAALPPEHYVSSDELHALTVLTDVLGYDVIDDGAIAGGLRLVEWVRGYAVLKEIANQEGPPTAHTSATIPHMHGLGQLAATLEQCGLPASRVQAFLDSVSLWRRSRDAFDCPLVRVGSDSALLLAPLLQQLTIAPALLSNLATRDEHLKHKGKAFEAAVRALFNSHGIKAVYYKAKRDGEIYEYDALVIWDDWVFVFECKNHSLPGLEPDATYYFDLDVATAARQAHRLAGALKRYPDILQDALGAKVEQHRVVPCVIHSLPYARDGGLDGVCFTDYSALHRFLKRAVSRCRPALPGRRTHLDRAHPSRRLLACASPLGYRDARSAPHPLPGQGRAPASSSTYPQRKVLCHRCLPALRTRVGRTNRPVYLRSRGGEPGRRPSPD